MCTFYICMYIHVPIYDIISLGCIWFCSVAVLWLFSCGNVMGDRCARSSCKPWQTGLHDVWIPCKLSKSTLIPLTNVFFLFSFCSLQVMKHSQAKCHNKFALLQVNPNVLVPYSCVYIPYTHTHTQRVLRNLRTAKYAYTDCLRLYAISFRVYPKIEIEIKK